MQNIRLRKISELMEEYLPVYPDDRKWASTIEYLLHEPSEKEIIEQLVEDLKQDGCFREPILAIEDTDDTDDEYVGGKHIADGTHRLVAAYIAGHETILTADNYFSDDEGKNFTTYVTSETKLDSDDLDLMFDYIRSLKINDNNWITSGISFQREYGEQSFYWDYNPDITAEEITEVVEKQLKRIFPHTDFKVKTEIELWEDEDEEIKETDEENSIWDDESVI